MLRSLQIEGYRGFRSLTVEDLGRVNLVIGRNNSGKSSLMEAACLALRGTASQLAWATQLRHTDRVDPTGASLFHHATHPGRCRLRATRADGATTEVRLAATPDGIRTWNADGTLADLPYEDGLVCGISSRDDRSEAGAVSLYMRLFIEGRSAGIVDALRVLEPTLESVDVVGDAVWVKHQGVARRLPLAALGEGARWLFDVAVSLHEPSVSVQGFDELDDGLHHAVLGPVFTLLRGAPPTLQLFGTTHRDETIRAACEAFLAAQDDGLRVIRLDRRPDGGHRAAVYDATSALRALDEGWEIRG